MRTMAPSSFRLGARRVALLAVVVAAVAGANALAPPRAVTLAGGEAVIGTDVDKQRFPARPSRTVYTHSWNGTSKLTGRHFTAHMARLDDPTYFGFEVIPGGCDHHTVTSTTAQHFDCLWATNGGFFGYPSGGCIGNLIINDTAVQAPGSATANFGLTSTAAVTGFISKRDIDDRKFGFKQLISGVGWLVRSGASNVDHSPDLDPKSSFTLEKAPRTGLGMAVNGSLIVLEVDGQEDIKAGFDLYEFAQLFVTVGANTAVNLDGGGSSVTCMDGHVISRPTCVDTSKVCERQVTSITCIRQGPSHVAA